MKVRLGDIHNTESRREHGDIGGLKASIREVGLIHPPTVDENLNLLAGRRRYQALLELYGPDYELEVTVLPVNGDRLKALKVAIDENLKRKPLTDPEVASAIKDYDELKRELEGEAKGGTRTDLGHSVTEVEGWSLQKTALDLAISKPAIVKAIQIATALEEYPELAKLGKGHAILHLYKARQRAAEYEKVPRPRRKGYPSFIPLEALWPTPRSALESHCNQVREGLQALTKQLKALEAPRLYAEEMASPEIQEAWAELKGALVQFKKVVKKAIEEAQEPMEEVLLGMELAALDLPPQVRIPVCNEEDKEYIRRGNEAQVKAYLEAGGIPYWREGKPLPPLPEPDDGGRPGWTRWGLEIAY